MTGLKQARMKRSLLLQHLNYLGGPVCFSSRHAAIQEHVNHEFLR
jgi:hypothetical protein